MKRFLTLLAMLCCLIGLFVVTASAESAATRVDYYATVNVDGDCLVTMSINLHLEESSEGLAFPLPANASNIKMNNASVNTSRVGSYTAVYLDKATGGSRGDFPIQLSYTLNKLVTVTEDRKALRLDLPILSGFSYPIQSLNYTITLPRENNIVPDFFSTYRQNGVASDLNCMTNGSMVTGSSKSAFNDHESLSMSMVVSTDMFPGVSTYQRNGNPELIPMGIFAGIALLYWLIFLRTLPPARDRSMMPPSGVSAGEMGCRLTQCGGDLTMMVFSWAQMGYLLLHVDNRGRVLIHKRMEMGNERSLFEIRVFQALFGDRRVIDCTGLQYAKNCRRTAAMVPGERAMCKPGPGNMKVFRALFCISQAFCGICLAMNMANITVLQVLLSLLLAPFGIVTAWLIQEIAYRTHVRGKVRAHIGLACCLMWIVLGLIAGQVWIPLGACVAQIVAGYFAAYGGRRTELNRMEMAQILSLRRYLKKMPKEDIPRLLQNDPEYFFRMAPYAMALGVLKPFAAAFGKRKMDQCPYMITPLQTKRKAQEWAELMVTAADRMDARFHQMELEKWMPVKVR